MITSLYLSPAANAALAVESGRVILALRDSGLIGARLACDLPGAIRYRAGESFARLIVFAGCAPHLLFEPAAPGDYGFCHVALHGPYAQPRLIVGRHSIRPRCPSCRHGFSAWRAQLSDWLERGLVCDGCRAHFAPAELDWRQHAASGRFLIEICNVFPGEAAPGDGLLQALADSSCQAWSYAWSDATLPA